MVCRGRLYLQLGLPLDGPPLHQGAVEVRPTGDGRGNGAFVSRQGHLNGYIPAGTCLQHCYCHVPAALLLPRACSAATAACLQRCYCMLRACYWRVPVNAKTRCPYVLLPGAIEWLGGHTIYTLL